MARGRREVRCGDCGKWYRLDVTLGQCPRCEAADAIDLIQGWVTVENPDSEVTITYELGAWYVSIDNGEGLCNFSRQGKPTLTQAIFDVLDGE